MTKFNAKLKDGNVLTELTLETFSKLLLHLVVEITIQMEGLSPITITADHSKGEEVNFFTRNSISVGDALSTLSVPVFEIRKNGATLCRLYWHPDTGPILSSKDLYF